jgi:hypothetical protein
MVSKNYSGYIKELSMVNYVLMVKILIFFTIHTIKNVVENRGLIGIVIFEKPVMI